ncbi:hypothetical protein CYLTODRAFT_487432 [Cylindrobasidium torrendii FP15055 ss-10]|uniref:Uncharacterized protein n=1 Tax=Cylindrobasidium torrendii FP15055 ss-10 TaxID=1314674 RepID=A0A0D7BNR9_9AGAR|nr:hypothetical protein CYLTODRAFT_487432 [Cylindrobasidium torrendii FP15055 ss-10]
MLDLYEGGVAPVQDEDEDSDESGNSDWFDNDNHPLPPESIFASNDQSHPDSDIFTGFESARMDATSATGPSERQRGSASKAPDIQSEWFPWPDKLSFLLDLLMHLPRSVFSERQLALFTWILGEAGVRQVPSVNAMKDMNQRMQEMCGIETKAYRSENGNVYHVNDFARIVEQEMSNPNVRPHLHFWPEDNKKGVSEARQASRWMHEMPDDLAPPMIRTTVTKKDFYTFEPSVILGERKYCIPRRWIVRDGVFWAKCSTIVPDQRGDGGWWVLSDDFEVPEQHFLLTFPEFCAKHEQYNVPTPTRIFGVWDGTTAASWTHTIPEEGNRWRKLANGRRVLSFPIWMYCDDTSGNVSKKWNKHNSFLFTAAGLPRAESQREYNIHFLCTSNIAAPLEMLDGITEQIEHAQANGITAFDIQFNEDVLIIPWVLALLGDNPMQSEFACHIGMRGKQYCRICTVVGKTREQLPGTMLVDDDDDEGNDSEESDNGSGNGKRRKFVETVDQIKRRIIDFIKPGEARSKEGTQNTLAQMFNVAKNAGSESEVKKMRTATGVKDTYQLPFLQKIWGSHRRLRNPDRKLDQVRSIISHFPNDITSPVWRLKGLDPHSDTPVEILHVVLLGFIKYLWRDVLRVQLKDKTAKLNELTQRLSSFDTSGLGIPALNGRTLVQYGLSLTGRDFRVIAQVAPFVLHDLISPASYSVWCCLSKLVPMIWQPKINNIDEYCTRLEEEIRVFLLRVSKWSARWFNKPKFHVLVHLPAHIRRFGPAILFATEAFESFNAVIRAQSVHSNRQAPSRDIARAFAQSNRIRHLVSGGSFTVADMQGKSVRTTAGTGPLRVVSTPESIIAQYLSLVSRKENHNAGSCINAKSHPVAYNATLTSKAFPTAFAREQASHALFQHAERLILMNGDHVRINEYVISRNTTSHREFGITMVCRVAEILRVVRTVNLLSIGVQKPDSILLQIMSVQLTASAYEMPVLVPSNIAVMVNIQDILGAVNAPHHCQQNGCSLTGHRTVLQERERTEHQVPVVEHQRNPYHRVLNIGQMHNSGVLEDFRVPSATISEAEKAVILHASAVEEHASQRRASKAGGPRAFSRPATPRIPPSRPMSSMDVHQTEASSSSSWTGMHW